MDVVELKDFHPSMSSLHLVQNTYYCSDLSKQLFRNIYLDIVLTTAIDLEILHTLIRYEILNSRLPADKRLLLLLAFPAVVLLTNSSNVSALAE